MKLRAQLTLIFFLIVFLMTLFLSSFTLLRSRALQTAAAVENMHNITLAHAMDMEARLNVPMNTIRTLAEIFNKFRDIDADKRRDFFNAAMKSTLESNPSFVGVYSVWIPDTVDDQGIYSPLFTREFGTITEQPFSTFNQGEYDRVLRELRRDEQIADPIPFVNLGKDTLFVTMTSPIVDPETNEVYGAVGVGVDLATIQEAVTSVTLYSDGYAALYSNNGTVAAHRDSARLGSNFRESALELLGPEGIALVEQSLAKGVPNQTTYGGNILVNYPFHVGNSSTPWTIIANAPLARVIAPVRAITKFVIACGLSLLAVVCLIMFLVIRRALQPVVNVALTLKDISEGEGDLTRQINIHAKNEIGDLARYFNATLEKIKQLVITIKNQSAALFDIGNELAGNMTETAAAINEITANIQSIKGRVINQSASVTETNATMEQITVNIDKLSNHVERQGASVAQSSSAIEEMLANIQSVTQTLIKNSDNARELIGASELGRSSLEEVITDIQEIAHESEGLLEINTVMENIASQTNLLSMNAAIEAAHAGEAGKGFAVVADEIRKLAESSGEQSKTISTVLKKIKDSIDKITKSAGSVLSKFEAIDGGVRTVSDQEENIRNAMEEQGAGSKQILEAISQLNEATQIVKDSSEEMSEGSKQVIQESKNLELVTQEITNGMNEMAVGADEINVAINRVNTISGQNKDNIEVLVREVSKFKVE